MRGGKVFQGATCTCLLPPHPRTQADRKTGTHLVHASFERDDGFPPPLILLRQAPGFRLLHLAYPAQPDSQPLRRLLTLSLSCPAGAGERGGQSRAEGRAGGRGGQSRAEGRSE